MKNPYNRINREKLSLGDLVCTISSCARNERETVAALLDMFQSGRVKLKDHGHLKRIKISSV